MQRRIFLYGLMLGALAATLAAEAQQAKQARRIGVLMASSPTVPTSWISLDRQRRMSIAFCVRLAQPNSLCRHRQST